jgi:hypothetical protein
MIVHPLGFSKSAKVCFRIVSTAVGKSAPPSRTGKMTLTSGDVMRRRSSSTCDQALPALGFLNQ